MLGRRGRELLQPRELAVGLLAHELGQLELRELLAQLLHLGLGRVALAELLLDRLQLLAQVVLALGLVHLGLDLRVDPRADLDDLELAREDLGEPVQAAGDVVLLQQRLALLAGDPQRAGDQVRERRRVLEVRHRHLQLLGQVRGVLDDLGELLAHVAHERLELRALIDDVRQLRDAGGEVGVGGGPLLDAHALAALDEHAQRPVGHLEHARHDAGDADRVQLLGPGLLRVGVAAGDHHEPAVGGQHVVDQRDRARLADGQRRQRVRERDGVAQRQDRKRRGQLGRLGRGHLALPDRDHEPSLRSGSIRTLCGRAGGASGSSTISIPSS